MHDVAGCDIVQDRLVEKPFTKTVIVQLSPIPGAVNEPDVAETTVRSCNCPGVGIVIPHPFNAEEVPNIPVSHVKLVSPPFKLDVP